jgi:hypothetical protein
MLEEKGLAGAFPFAPIENGFENGFAGAAGGPPPFTPNSDPPMFIAAGFASSCTGFTSAFLGAAFAPEPLATLTPRIPLTLPSFRRHVFRRQAQIYSRLS